MCQRKNYLRRLLRLIKFSVSLKHSIIKTNKLFHAGAVVVTSSLGVKIDKVTGRKGTNVEEKIAK